MKKITSILFLICLIIPNFCFYCFFIRGQKETSKIEQRPLQKIPEFLIKDFVSTEYQGMLENSIADQMLLSERNKFNYYKFIFRITKTQKSIFNIFFDLSNNYINLKSKYYLYGDSDYIVEKKIKVLQKNFDEYIKIYNNISYPGVEKYIYFINKDTSIDFSSNNYNTYNEKIKENFKADDYGFFNINSFDEYKEYFYQTDHHWNYKGAYKGYVDIVKLLLGNEEKVLKPIEKVTFDCVFNGSYSRQIANIVSKEKFSVYKFENLNYNRYIKEKKYGVEEPNLSNLNNCSNLYTNYYADYYGAQEKDVLYDFNQKEKENLLVISNSYMYAIDDLLSSHFNQTYYLDIRGRAEELDNDFFAKIIKKYNIDKILIVGDIYFFSYI